MNNRSVVTALRCGRQQILFTADVEQDALIRMRREVRSGRADLVKVPHHGAASSLQLEWLDEVHPRYAVISVGRHNAYGHPALSVLQAYADRGITTYRTDRDGGVWVTGRSSGRELRMHTAREQVAQRIPFPGCRWTCERLNWERVISRWRE